MKHRVIQLFSSDRGKILLLTLLVLLLAFGGVQLNKLVSTNMLRADAISTVSAWADNLITNADDIPAMIAGRSPSARTEHLLKDATEVGDIYRFKIMDRTGHTVFSSERPGFTATPAPAKSMDTNNFLQSVLSGATLAEIGVGKSPENPPYFVLCYLPIQKNGEVLGMLEVYIDQTEDHAIYQRSLLFTESIVAFMVLLAGGIPGFMVHRKMRDHRRAEERIQLQKTQLQNVFDNVNEGILLMDMDHNVVQINRTALRLLGISDDTHSWENLTNVFEVMSPNGDLLPRNQWPSALAYNGEFLENREFKIRRVDTGASILTQISSAPVLDSSGKTIQILYSYRDITRTKKADEERKRLAAIVDSSLDAIISKDDKGIVTSWNEGATKVFGYTAEEMIGQSITRLLPEDRLNEETNILARIKRGEVVDHFETVRIRKDGHAINVSLTISPIRDASGNVIGASKIARNITDRIKLERQLQQSQKMDAIGQLTGGIAHDFNNLLGVVIGNLDLLGRHIHDDNKAARRLETAKKAASRGADLTRRLLAFSSNETLSPTPTKLHHLIRNVIEMTDRLVGPEIKITIGANESIPAILVDAAGLESALVNLVVNARDAMPKGGAITISTELSNIEADYPPVQAGELKAGSYVCVSISDTGYGMSRQTLERVFEPFFTTKPLGKGTGLGLAMVYGFIKQSQGAVRIYSELNLGTTVNLYLPLGDVTSVPAPDAVEPARPFRDKFTALVVDDELELLDIATTYLEDLGCKTYTAVDGNEALKIIELNMDIELLVTDIIMPGGMNGVELAQKARLLNPAIKVIYCSGFPAGALADRSMLVVDGPLLHKPYQHDEFTALVRRVMGTDNEDLMK